MELKTRKAIRAWVKYNAQSGVFTRCNKEDSLYGKPCAVDYRGRIRISKKLYTCSVLAHVHEENRLPDNVIRVIDKNHRNTKYNNYRLTLSRENRRKVQLTQEYLKDLLYYNKKTGVFKWRVQANGRLTKGAVAGCLNDGYVQIIINSVSYRAHNLAWFYEYGYWPAELDHKNLLRSDNRIDNLRECTHSQNCCNKSDQKNNTSGYRGVYKRTRHNRTFYFSTITFNKKRYNLGDFATAFEAHLAYEKASVELHKEFKYNPTLKEEQMQDWDTVSFGNEKRVRFNELVKVVDYRKSSKFQEYRFIGPLTKYAVQWLPIYKDGKPVKSQSTGNDVNIPFNITNFDPETGTFDTSKTCPLVEVAEKIQKYIEDDKARKQFDAQTGFYAQAINRKLQANPDSTGKPTKAERASGFKESIDSESFTPVEVHQINFTVGQGIETARELNTVKLKGSTEKVKKSIADPKYGCDIMIKYDKDAKGQGKYKVQKGERTPLDTEAGEDKYLLWDIVGALKATTLSRKEAKIEAERILAEFMKSIKGTNGKKKSTDDDDDDTDDMPDDLEGDDSPAPVKGKKKKVAVEDDDSPAPVKAKKKKVVEPEDEDEEDTEDSPAPVKKKKPKVEEDSPAPVKKKKKAVEPEPEEEDDDEDFDLDDLDDDESDDD